MLNQQLYENIVAFDIDGGPVTQTFEMRLARENGWTEPFAKRVVVEYKRFVYLTMTADHRCSPSHAVDEAWHLHLTYTESYWLRMVADVLPRPLHHNPTKGGSSENAKHEDFYKRTLDSYIAAFGSEPPLDIWPIPGQKPVQLSSAEEQNWVISKSKVRVAAQVLVGAVAAAGIVAGCMPMLAQAGPDPDPFPTGLVVGGLLIAAFGLMAIFFVVWWVRRSSQYGNTTVIGGSCDNVVIIENDVVACSGGGNCSGGGQAAPSSDSVGAVAEAAAADAVSDSGSSSCSSSSCSSSSCSGGGCSS